MKEIKHTPASWTISATNPYRINTSKEQLLLPIAEAYYHVDGDNPTYEEAKANALLIASAPELLEKLEQLVFMHSCEQEGIGCGMPTTVDWYNAVKQAYLVIQKAKGENEE
jgi:hypothetical protein